MPVILAGNDDDDDDVDDDVGCCLSSMKKIISKGLGWAKRMANIVHNCKFFRHTIRNYTLVGLVGLLGAFFHLEQLTRCFWSVLGVGHQRGQNRPAVGSAVIAPQVVAAPCTFGWCGWLLEAWVA